MSEPAQVQAPVDTVDGTPTLVFDFGAPAGEEPRLFGLDATQVLRVFEPTGVAPVPHAPNLVLGITNHHGRIVTVIDPTPLLGLPRQSAPLVQAILLRQGRSTVGHLGLQVSRVRDIVSASGLAASEVAAGPCVGYVAKVDRRLIHVVRVEVLLESLGRMFGVPHSAPPSASGVEA